MSLPANLITNRTAKFPGDYKVQVHGRPRTTPGTMNKAEAKYALELEARRRTCEIVWWAFEPIKLRLAERTFYTPDFAVLKSDGLFELHEVKGFWQDDARVKWKVVKEKFWMFEFVEVTA